MLDTRLREAKRRLETNSELLDASGVSTKPTCLIPYTYMYTYTYVRARAAKREGEERGGGRGGGAGVRGSGRS